MNQPIPVALVGTAYTPNPLPPIEHVSDSEESYMFESVESDVTDVDEEFEANFRQIMMDRQRDERIMALRTLEARVMRNMLRLSEAHAEDVRILQMLRDLINRC